MGKRILVPIDESEQAMTACRWALGEFPDAEFVLLHVIDPAEASYSGQASIPSFSEKWYEQAEADAEQLFEQVRTRADGNTIVETDITVGKPSSAIVNYADDHDIDQIVMGSHGRSGVSRILLGSVAETVVRRASVPVTVAR